MPSDPTLALPDALTAVPELTGPSDTLAHAGAARPRPFLLVTRGCSARGVETRGVETVEIGGRVLLGGLGPAGATCGNVLIAPTQSRRELLVRAESRLETLLVTSDGLVAQWMRPPGARADEIRLVLRLPGTSWRAEGPLLRAEAPDGVRLLHLLPAPTWSVREEREHLIVTALVAGRENERISLLATADADATGAAARLRRLTGARAPQAEADLVALRTRRLATHTGVPEIDDGLAWAQARTDAAAGADGQTVHELAHGQPFPFDPDARRAWTALGALASGNRERLQVTAATPLGMLALARAAEWRGEPMSQEARAQLRAADTRPQTQTTAANTAAYRAGLLAAADAVEPWEGKPAADALRARADAVVATIPRTTGLRLPTLGSSILPADPMGALVAAALELPGRDRWVPPDEDSPPGILRALTAWACLNDGPLERGFALFRQHLADGFTAGVGLWPDGERIHDPAAAALVPLVLLQGLLGARIDAYHGRLRLAPRLPPQWTRFSMTGLAISDATVRMTYEIVGGRHRFRFVQESGRMPVMLIFEPIVAASPHASTWVDGAPAELELRAMEDRIQASVQLPLDREREVAIGAE